MKGKQMVPATAEAARVATGRRRSSSAAPTMAATAKAKNMNRTTPATATATYPAQSRKRPVRQARSSAMAKRAERAAVSAYWRISVPAHIIRGITASTAPASTPVARVPNRWPSTTVSPQASAAANAEGMRRAASDTPNQPDQKCMNA